VVGAKGQATSIAVELVAAEAEQRTTIEVGAGLYFQDCVNSVSIEFQWNAVESSIAVGTGSGGEVLSHCKHYMLNPLQHARSFWNNVSKES